eukprot:CCRYP_013929-RA/>CCRYP_013929-RA protein AED:0.27 eAED:0.27 QI:0/-1/0/1/-1/1/1/0/322
MQLNTTPAWVEDFDGTEIGDFVMRRPTSAPTSCTRSNRDTSRVVHVIEPDDDDFTTPHRARNASSREPSSSHSIARPAPKQHGTPRDSSKSRDEQAGRRPHSSSNKCSLPLDSCEKTPRRRGKIAGPSVLSTLDELPVVSPPASNDNRDAKLRRSTRTKVKPLEFWNNERPIYGPHNEIGLLGEAMGNMPVVVGVQRKSGVKYFDRSQGVVTRNVVNGDASKKVSLKAKSSANSRETVRTTKKGDEVNRSNIKRISKLKDANERLRNQLQCPICYELQEGNMYLIMECGHRICGDCSLLLGNKCHTCRTSLDKERGWLKKIY